MRMTTIKNNFSFFVISFFCFALCFLFSGANGQNEMKLFDLKKDMITEKYRALFFDNKFGFITIDEENALLKSKNEDELFKEITTIAKRAIATSKASKDELADIFIPFITFCDEILVCECYDDVKKLIYKKIPNNSMMHELIQDNRNNHTIASHNEFKKKKHNGMKKTRNVKNDPTLADCPIKRTYAIECFEMYFDLNHDHIVQKNEIEDAKKKYPPIFLKLFMKIITMFSRVYEPVHQVMLHCDLNCDGEITMDEFFNETTTCLDTCDSLMHLEKYFCSRAKDAAEKELFRERKRSIDEIIKIQPDKKEPSVNTHKNNYNNGNDDEENDDHNDDPYKKKLFS